MKNNDWPTKQHDLEIVAEVIKRHVVQNGGEPIPLLDVAPNKKSGETDYKISAWLTEIMDYFIAQYGFEQGQVITGKVFTQILLSGQTVH